MLDLTKTTRQQSLAVDWKDSGGLGGIQAPPGFGKTYLTLNFICKPMLEKREHCHFLIVVHSDDLRKQWREQIEEMFPIHKNQFLVDTIQAYQRRRKTYQVSLLILDEVDEYFSEDRSNIWNGTWCRFRFLLWLSATPDDTQKRDKEFITKYPRIGHVTIPEAIEAGWIDNFEIINVPIQLTEEERENFNANEVELTDYLSKFDGDLSIAYACTGGRKTAEGYVPWSVFCENVSRLHGWNKDFQKYIAIGFPLDMKDDTREHILMVHKMWNPSIVKGYAEQCIKCVERRSDILWNSENKRNKTVELIKQHEDVKKIVFSMRVSFIETTAKMLHNEGINVTMYHSSLVSRPLRANDFNQPSLFGTHDYFVYKSGAKKGEPKIFGAAKIKSLALEHFKNGDVNNLLVCSGIDKGSDFPSVKVAIIAANSKSSNQLLQRMGRATRKFGEETTIVYNLYVPGTREEYNLKKQMKELPTIKIEWLPIDWSESYEDDDDLFNLF